MEIQRLYSHVRRACDDYGMIHSGDKIAIGISGGKDSLTLLYALSGMRRFYPKQFELIGITVDLGYENCDYEELHALCEDLQVEYHVIHTHIKKILEEKIEDGSYCSLCSKMRKGAINDAAIQLGCNKIAYAHHMDDMIETMFLSLMYEGRFYVFPPVTCMPEQNLTIIRPLMYVSEVDVIGFQNKTFLPVLKNPCPYDGQTKREYVKNLIARLNRENPGVKKQLFHAITEGNICDWPKKRGS